MAKQFTIDDAFSLEGEEEGVGPGEDLNGWKDREREREGEMTFGPLTFSKPQSLPSSSAGTADHSNLKYQVRVLFFFPLCGSSPGLQLDPVLMSRCLYSLYTRCTPLSVTPEPNPS